MLEKKIVISLLCLVVVLGFSATATMGANILFIVNDPTFVTYPNDAFLRDFFEVLGHTVTFFDDNGSEADMEAAAAAADLVWISESVGSSNVANKITEVEVPMVVGEPYCWDEMGMTLNSPCQTSAVATTDITIVNPGHYLSAGLNGTVTVLTDLVGSAGTPAEFANGMIGGEGTVIATATLADGQTWDVIVVYEKGAKLAVPPGDGSPQVAADIRIGTFFHYNAHDVLNDNAYALIEAAINYALGLMGPPALAGSPRPGDGAKGVPKEVALTWRPGAYVEGLSPKHRVFFSENFADVNDGVGGIEQDVARYPVDGTLSLEMGKTYYWRVDEANSTTGWDVGNLWQFTVTDYLVVDSFEDYKNSPVEAQLYNTWIDGWEVPENGAMVGHDIDITQGGYIVETKIVHGGRQSMPYTFDNRGPANYSEAQRTFSPAQDWTREGVETLSLWFKGYPAYVGSFVEAPAGTYTMIASGTDIWSTADEFHFAYKEATGAVTVIAKVESVENMDPWAKAGVMIRDTLEPDSVNVALLVTPGNGVRFQFRNNTGNITDRNFAEGITAPQWVKLERTVGGLVRASYSADGSAWTQVGMGAISMKMPVYMGLALTSHEAKLTCEAKFSNVTITGTDVSAQWTDLDIGILSNDAEPMYVTVGDGSGTAATVYHDNPAATQIDTWMEWTIPLTDLSNAGVVLTDVSNLAIGFGDKSNPQPGGTGLMYFDDIRLYLPAPQP